MASSLEHAVLLEQVQRRLTIFYEALSARSVSLVPLSEEERSSPPPDTRSTVRLPAEQESADWYKLAVGHRAIHYESGTYKFKFLSPARHFSSLRPDSLKGIPVYDGDSQLDWFFRLFANRALALDLFNVLEDFRIDEWAARKYKGLAGLCSRIQSRELDIRPDVSDMAPRQALAEVIVRLSLNDRLLRFDAPAFLRDSVSIAVGIFDSLGTAGATVEDAAEATIRIYHLLVAMPNVAVPGIEKVPIALSESRSHDAGVRWPTEWPEPDPVHLEGDVVLEVRFEPVSYREQMGFWLRNYEASAPPELQSIFTFRDMPARSKILLDPDPMAMQDDEFEQDLQSPPKPLPHDHGHEEEDHEHAAGEIHTHDPDVFIYPEWDYQKNAYLKNWCALREQSIAGGSEDRLYSDTLRRNSTLIPRILKVVESIAPENLRKVYRMPFGDDIDIDACIDAVIDLSAGVKVSDNVYSARERVARDVAVAFLLDLSASTAESVAGSSDPKEESRRIIDVEKESMMLMLAVTTKVGDAVAIYGFSGTGRNDVQFFCLKEFKDRFSAEVVQRIGALKPVHTTRMAPAIRHAVRKLVRQECQTKMLMIISDGRPFDIDYGIDYGEEFILDYAVQDTRKALDEARANGVVPFLLTVDEEGNDYLREMCSDMGYEIISDITQLPLRIVSLYRELRAG